WVETDGYIQLLGRNVEVAGVVKGHALTPDATDWEVVIDAQQTATVNGDLDLLGSTYIHGGRHVAIYNTDLTVTRAGQRPKVESGDTIKLGEIGIAQGHPVFPDGQHFMMGAVLSAPRSVEVLATGDVEVNSGVLIFANQDDSLLRLSGADVRVVGGLYAGA